MRHPSEGVLRRLVDEPAGVTDDDRAHVAGCPTCLRGAGRPPAPTPRLVDAALATSGRRRHRRRLGPVRDDRGRARRRPVRRRRAGRPLAAGACAVPVVAALSAVVLGDRRRRRRRQRLAADLPHRAGRPDRGHLDRPRRACPTSPPTATSRSPRSPTRSRWPTPRPRASATGLAVPEVAELPAGRDRGPGLPGRPAAVSATFTFSAEKAAQAAAAEGEALPPPPAGLDGSSAPARRPARASRPSGRSPRVCRRSSSPASARRRSSPPACRSRRCATTCCPCPGCPPARRPAARPLRRTAARCRCPCRRSW